MLSQDTEGSGRFMTLFYLELDTRSHELEWVRAGHDAAMIFNPPNDSFRELDGPGIPLGVLGEYPFVSRGGQRLEPGELMLIASDGVWETRSPGDELFGKPRTMELLRRLHQLPAEQIVQGICQDLAQYRADDKAEDDITIIVIKALT